MDLLQSPPAFDLYDPKWRIYARNPIMPPHYVGKGAIVEDSMVTEGCEVNGDVRHSVLFAGVRIDRGATVEDSVIMPGAVIMAGAVVRRAIVGENAVISAGCTVGTDQGDIALVGQDTVLPKGYTVQPGAQIDMDALAAEEEGASK